MLRRAPARPGVRLVFTPQGWEDYTYWQRTDRALVKRINRLLDDALRNPTSGIGRPEALKYGIAGAWSRRITEEHRLAVRCSVCPRRAVSSNVCSCQLRLPRPSLSD
ncbi:MAG TPA: Txe/YoeB family addiction module toxin [Solirubrobacteraceae bacterium]